MILTLKRQTYSVFVCDSQGVTYKWNGMEFLSKCLTNSIWLLKFSTMDETQEFNQRPWKNIVGLSTDNSSANVGYFSSAECRVLKKYWSMLLMEYLCHILHNRLPQGYNKVLQHHCIWWGRPQHRPILPVWQKNTEESNFAKIVFCDAQY